TPDAFFDLPDVRLLGGRSRRLLLWSRGRLLLYLGGLAYRRGGLVGPGGRRRGLWNALLACLRGRGALGLGSRLLVCHLWCSFPFAASWPPVAASGGNEKRRSPSGPIAERKS